MTSVEAQGAGSDWAWHDRLRCHSPERPGLGGARGQHPQPHARPKAEGFTPRQAAERARAGAIQCRSRCSRPGAFLRFAAALCRAPLASMLSTTLGVQYGSLAAKPR